MMYQIWRLFKITEEEEVGICWSRRLHRLTAFVSIHWKVPITFVRPLKETTKFYQDCGL